MSGGYIYGLIDPSVPEHIRYVGQTVRTLAVRLDCHRYNAEADGTPVQAWVHTLVVAGWVPLIVELEHTDTTDALNVAEKAWIKRLRPQLLNVAAGGNSPSEEALANTRARQVAAARARRHPPATRARMSAAHRGHEVSAETREKIATAHRGRTHSAEQRSRVSAALMGRTLPPETRAKMSAARTGVAVHSAESKAAIGAAQRGKVVSAETRAKIGAANGAAAKRRRAAQKEEGSNAA